MQINRLFEIVYILLERKTITAKELAERFEVSTRTIYRDIEILSQAKIPVYANKGNGGGIGLLEDYVLDKSMLSEEEQNQILFALQSMEKISNQDEKNILEKMSSIFNKSKTNWIDVDFSDWGINGEQDQTFNLIRNAILKHNVIEFVYYNSYGEEKKRQAEPLQIYFKDKSWYLKAYCRLKQDYRLFKISRMKDIKLLNETFERELPQIKENKFDYKTIQLELEISKDMSYRVYDEFKREDIIKNKNGDFTVKVEFPENDWVYGYILSFGENVKVLSPGYVKSIIKEKLQKSLKNYF
jgi:predicted DNA-binding transcriptional regulator YafY